MLRTLHAGGRSFGYLVMLRWQRARVERPLIAIPGSAGATLPPLEKTKVPSFNAPNRMAKTS